MLTLIRQPKLYLTYNISVITAQQHTSAVVGTCSSD